MSETPDSESEALTIRFPMASAALGVLAVATVTAMVAVGARARPFFAACSSLLKQVWKVCWLSGEGGLSDSKGRTVQRLRFVPRFPTLLRAGSRSYMVLLARVLFFDRPGLSTAGTCCSFAPQDVEKWKKARNDGRFSYTAKEDVVKQVDGTLADILVLQEKRIKVFLGYVSSGTMRKWYRYMKGPTSSHISLLA